MAIHEKIQARCPKCDKEVAFKIKMCLVDYDGIVPCYKCPKCGIIVPSYSFRQFLEDGRVREYV